MSRIFSGTNLIAIALSALLIYNLVGLVRSHTDLADAHEKQDQLIAQGSKIEAQADALAQGTKALADAGNANARKVIEILSQNGINIGAPAGK